MLASKKISSKINYAALEDLFKDPGDEAKPSGANDGTQASTGGRLSQPASGARSGAGVGSKHGWRQGAFMTGTLERGIGQSRTTNALKGWRTRGADGATLGSSLTDAGHFMSGRTGDAGDPSQRSGGLHSGRLGLSQGRTQFIENLLRPGPQGASTLSKDVRQPTQSDDPVSSLRLNESMLGKGDTSSRGWLS